MDRFVTRPEVTRKLFATIAPWYAERQGGYTRIVRIGRRLGDAGETAYLELVKSEEQKEAARQARLQAAEAKERSTKGEKPEKKPKAEAAPADEGERPKRGRRREGDPAVRRGARAAEHLRFSRQRARAGERAGARACADDRR